MKIVRPVMAVCVALSLAVPQPVSSQAAPPPVVSQTVISGLDGDWEGTLAFGGMELRVIFHVMTWPGAGTTATLDSIDQDARGLPIDAVTKAGDSVTFSAAALQGGFSGKLSSDGRMIVGTWRQLGTDVPLTLILAVPQRASSQAAAPPAAAPVPIRPQLPKTPYPYVSKEVGYDNAKRPGVHLAGTLTLPRGAGPFPAVLLITGSGAQDRDETIFGHKPFLVLADHLTRQGFAVLRVDDRGRGGSTGAGPNDTTNDYATDVEAGVAWLKTQREIDARRISLIGHSEGGIVAPIVASRDPSIASVVLWAGPGVSGANIMVEQVRAILLASGVSAEVADAQARLQRSVMNAVINNPDDAAARDAVSKIMADAGAPALVDGALRQATSPWYRNFLAYDPAPTLRTLRMPVLALLGGKDLQIVATQNAPALREALKQNRNAQVVELPGLNHLFQTAATGAVQEYGKIEETVAPIALKTISDWMVAMTGPVGQPEGCK